MAQAKNSRRRERYANRSGAYTTIDPLRVTISSLMPATRATSLEVLFHEASHGIAEPVQSAIVRECRQRDKAIPRDLWHALIFYTTGEVISPLMTAPTTSPGRGRRQTQHKSPSSRSHRNYTPYAIREGLYERGWKDYLPASHPLLATLSRQQIHLRRRHRPHGLRALARINLCRGTACCAAACPEHAD